MVHRAGALWLVGLLGCSSVTSTTTTVRHLPPRTLEEPPRPEDDRLLADVEVREDSLRVALRVTHFCRVTHQQRWLQVTREHYGVRPVPTVIGATLMTLGVLGLAVAAHQDALCDRSPSTCVESAGGSSFSFPAMLTLGGAIPLLIGVNAHDDVTREREQRNTRHDWQSCGASPAGGLRVALTLSDRTSLGGWTDADGVVRMPLGEKERASLSASQGRGWIFVQGGLLRSVDLSSELPEPGAGRVPRER